MQKAQTASYDIVDNGDGTATVTYDTVGGAVR